MRSLFGVSQSLLGSNRCCGFLIGLFRHGVPLIRCGVLLLGRGGLLPCLLRTGGLLLCLLRRGGLLPCLLCTGGLQLCLLCRGGLLPCLLCTGGLLLCLLRRGGLLPCLLCTGGFLLCLLRRGGWRMALVVFCSGLEIFCSALVGSSPVCFALVGSGLVTLVDCSAGFCSWSWHFLMDLSLPWFHLRSTALLDCSEFGASGSGLCHKFGSWASFQLTTRGHSLTTWTLALH